MFSSSLVLLLFLDVCAICVVIFRWFRTSLLRRNAKHRTALGIQPGATVLGLFHPYWYLNLLYALCIGSYASVVMQEEEENAFSGQL